jgi:hypothetical protein
VNVGKHALAVLNYAYALEQLEAAFYIKVTARFLRRGDRAEKRPARRHPPG